MTYKIVRYYRDPGFKSRVVRRGLTLEEAQAHCNDPETSSRTCTLAPARRRTRLKGPWFDGYTEE
jgi:hypothetical protein